jgi:FkbM family methyltransferase
MGMIRKIALKVLKATAFDTTIKHHFTKRRFMLNSYKHKGYWYYGANREAETIRVFQSWIKPGQYALEIGGHIGYFTTFYANLVQSGGKVDVFEPSAENRRYLEKNISLLPGKLSEIVTVVPKGAGDIDGVLEFYLDPITGQNNSFVKDFEGFFSNREHSADTRAELVKETVDVTRLDTYLAGGNRMPDFVKIDVEGFEWNVIQGFARTIEKAKPALMIEIQADADKLIPFFKENGYAIYNDKLAEIADHADYLKKKSPNIFFKYHA